MLAGAFGALVGAGSGSTGAGFIAGIAAGAAIGIVFAAFSIWLRADQIITGTAVNLLALGATGALYRGLYGATGAALSIPTSGPRCAWSASSAS